jgi:phospholipase A2
MPIIPNEKVSPGLDPYAVSTFKFEMSEDESGALMNLAEVSYILAMAASNTNIASQFNFNSGHEKLRAILKAMWLRKKRERLETEHHHARHRFEYPP